MREGNRARGRVVNGGRPRAFRFWWGSTSVIRLASFGRVGQLALALRLLSAQLGHRAAKPPPPSSARASGTPAVAAAIVVDMNTGIILYSQAPDTPRYPASLTKMMTLYVLFGCLSDGKITLSSDLVGDAARREPGADQTGPQAGHDHQGRGRDQGAGDPVRQRRRRHHRREPRRHRGEFRPRYDADGAAASA